MEPKFEDLLGKTIELIENHDDIELVFTTSTGERYILYHDQDCCESVSINDIEGNLDDLIGTPITQAEENSNNDPYNGKPENPDSFTWTFYKLATVKGYVTIRWLGESNGYYSEDVSFKLLT